MADLVVTASQVLAPTDGSGDFLQGIAGASITAGQSCYLDSTTNTIKLADANASQATAAAKGVATHAALTGQPVRLQTGGYITIGAGAAPAVGTVYVVSATAGGIAPAADLATGMYTTIIGVGASTNRIYLDMFVSNSVVP